MNEHGVLEGLGARAYDACIPLHVSLELTTRCPLRCTHCYNFDRDGSRPLPAGGELEFPEIEALLVDLRASGTLFLSLTGGEALSHPRVWDVLDRATALGFATNVLTSGVPLTEEVCARLAACPSLWGVSVSLYGASDAVHDAVTRRPGSRRLTMDGARRLQALGVAVTVKVILMKGNAAEAADMIRTAGEEGFACAVDPSLTARYDGTSGSLAERLDEVQLEALYRGPLSDRVRKGSEAPTDDEFKCNCARGNAAVSATGEVWPCIAAPLRAGNIRELPFSRIWAESPVFRRLRGLGVQDFRTCAPCSLKAWCRRSPGSALLNTGDYTGADPWTCREAALLQRLQIANPVV